mmetsp:Transcript_24221/g.91394  ORF Transcript_24221/g.91394 Transcript_24221/m.91394 type:complete len:234 (-) Transcript_24221:214-915(-)
MRSAPRLSLLPDDGGGSPTGKPNGAPGRRPSECRPIHAGCAGKISPTSVDVPWVAEMNRTCAQAWAPAPLVAETHARTPGTTVMPRLRRTGCSSDGSSPRPRRPACEPDTAPLASPVPLSASEQGGRVRAPSWPSEDSSHSEADSPTHTLGEVPPEGPPPAPADPACGHAGTELATSWSHARRASAPASSWAYALPVWLANAPLPLPLPGHAGTGPPPPSLAAIDTFTLHDVF